MQANPPNGWFIVASLIAILILIIWVYRLSDENKRLLTAREVSARQLFTEWQAAETDHIKTAIKKEFDLDFERYKMQWEADIRHDAVTRSNAILSGKYVENFIPFVESFEFNPRDARFIGNPIDLIVFSGASEKKPITIIFVEVKTGRSVLNDKQKLIRDAIDSKRVTWKEIRV
jgi:predicted Holliday junction resolvase-like endonuclease